MIRALYVDDEPALLKLGSFFLGRCQDLVLDTEESVSRALEKLKSVHYDVIISDFQMPEMDGIDFLKCLRRDYTKRIPFILFTGRGREEVAIEALNSGADFYLQKGVDAPAQFAVLENFIHQAVEKMRAEEELKRSEDRYRNIVEDQMESICRFLPDGTHVFVNSAYCEFLGKSREDLVGKKFFPCVPPEDRKRLKNHFRSLTPENPRASIEQRVILPDNTIRWIRCNDRAIFDENGHVREYQSVARDITGQKLAEMALKNSEKRLQDIINFFPNAFYAIDPEGRIIAWNRAAEELTGAPASDMLGKSGYEYSVRFYGRRQPALVDLVLHPEKAGECTYKKVRKHWGNTLSSESRILRKDGKKVPTLIKAGPIYTGDGTLAGAIETIQDVSTYKLPGKHQVKPAGAGFCRVTRELME